MVREREGEKEREEVEIKREREGGGREKQGMEKEIRSGKYVDRKGRARAK